MRFATRRIPFLGRCHLVAIRPVLFSNRPFQYRFFNWSYTVNGGESFVTAPSTPNGSTTIHALTPLTEVGVRVSMTTRSGTGAWSDVFSLLVL